MSDDLHVYMSLKQRIVELEKSLQTQMKLKSKYKRKYEKLKEEITGRKPKSRCAIAIDMITAGEMLTETAKRTGLAYSTVKGLARDYRKALALDNKKAAE